MDGGAPLAVSLARDPVEAGDERWRFCAGASPDL